MECMEPNMVGVDDGVSTFPSVPSTTSLLLTDLTYSSFLSSAWDVYKDGVQFKCCTVIKKTIIPPK